MSQETKNKNEQPKDEAVSEQVSEKEPVSYTHLRAHET